MAGENCFRHMKNIPEYTQCSSRYPLELHLVHRNIHDDTVEEALEHENGLTVLGFKFKVVDEEKVSDH